MSDSAGSKMYFPLQNQRKIHHSFFAFSLLFGLAAVTSTAETSRISVSSSGIEGNQWSYESALSADGRSVAFQSAADNLTPGDANGLQDVFVHNRDTRETVRVSVNSAGEEANAASFAPAISASGRWVAFQSEAFNLVSGDANWVFDIFVRDQALGQTERVSLSSGGTEANSDSAFPAISNDGRWVAFESSATNLAPGDTNNVFDIFLHDRQSRATERVSLSSASAQANSDCGTASVSADGNRIAFWSAADNLVPGDTNGSADVFVRDRLSQQTHRVSITSSGEQANSDSLFPALSADGRRVAFVSLADNLAAGDHNGYWDAFVHDLETGVTTRVSVSTGGVGGESTGNRPSISGDGRWVAFDSLSANLVPGDANSARDVFVHDLATGETTRHSIGNLGAEPNGPSQLPTLSADGRSVAFQSTADNLVDSDTNDGQDIFVRETTPACVFDVELSYDSSVQQLLIQLQIGSTAPANRLTVFLATEDGVTPLFSSLLPAIDPPVNPEIPIPLGDPDGVGALGVLEQLPGETCWDYAALGTSAPALTPSAVPNNL